MAKYKEIKYGTAFPASNLTDFPKLFEISGDTDIAAELAGGGGIELYLADGTTAVPFGLYPSTSLASGNILMRVKMSPLTAATTGDVMLRLRYGSGLTTVEDKSGTVSNNYVLFMPLEEDPSGSAPQMFDWVSGTKVGTSNGSMTSGELITGQVGKALSLSGSGQYIDVPDTVSLRPLHFHVSTWVKSALNGNYQGIIGKLDYNTDGGWGIEKYVSDNFRFQVQGNAVTSDSAFTDTNWHKVEISYDGSTCRMYVDGVLQSQTISFSLTQNTLDVVIGRYYSNNNVFYWDGKIDEVVYTSAGRAVDWVSYAYADETTNSDTFSLGAEQTEGGGGSTVYHNLCLLGVGG